MSTICIWLNFDHHCNNEICARTKLN